MTRENAIVYFNQISAPSPEAEMAFAIATEAIRLTIPEKPIDVNRGYFKTTKYGRCPTCGRRIDDSFYNCIRCGQRLDWGE